MSRVFYGWWIVAAAFLTLALTVGIPFYGMPFFYDHFQHAFGWTRGQVTSGIGIATVLALPVGGLILPRFTPRQLLIFGVALLSASLVGFSFLQGSIAIYYLMWVLFMLGYLCAGPIPHQVLIARWFVKDRGTAMGISYLGLGLGGAISQKFVLMPLIERLGWRGALLTTGLALLALIPFVLAVVRNWPEDCGLLPYGGTATVAPNPTSFRTLLSSASFWLLAIGSCASIGAIGSVNQHMKLLFLDAGLSAGVTANTTFIMLISSLLGRMIMGWLADRMPKKYVMIASYILIAAPLPLLFVAGRPSVPVLFGALFGFGLGADYMLIPLMAAELFGTHSLARVMGVLLPVNSITQTVCPLLAGALYTSTGNYRSALIFIIALAVAGAGAICFLPLRKAGAKP